MKDEDEFRSFHSPFILHLSAFILLIMIIYGVNPILESIRSHPDRVRYVGVAREQSSRHQKLIAEAKKSGVSVRTMTSEQIDRLASRGVHNGVVAEISESAYADFDEAIESAKFVLILDGITDPQNFGAILRVADGFGVKVGRRALANGLLCRFDPHWLAFGPALCVTGEQIDEMLAILDNSLGEVLHEAAG